MNRTHTIFCVEMLYEQKVKPHVLQVAKHLTFGLVFYMNIVQSRLYNPKPVLAIPRDLTSKFRHSDFRRSLLLQRLLLAFYVDDACAG